MEKIETFVYAARGNSRALEKAEEKLIALLSLVRAFQNEARQSAWAVKNLGVRP